MTPITTTTIINPTELTERFLEATRKLSSREVEERTGISDATVNNLRGGGIKRPHRATQDKMLGYLNSLGLLGGSMFQPRDAGGVPRTLTEFRGGRAEIAIQHFASPAVARALGWDGGQISDALMAFALEQQFDPEDMRKVRAEIAHLRGHGGD